MNLRRLHMARVGAEERHSSRSSAMRRISSTFCLLAVSVLLLLLATPSHAAFVNFENCLSPGIINGDPPPLHLQFKPVNVTTHFNLSDPGNTLNITIYGNVAGQAQKGTLPAPSNDSHWNNDNETFGKVIDLDNNTHIYTTLFAEYYVLNYKAFSSAGDRFCEKLDNNESCPLAPVFKDLGPQDYEEYPSITYSHPMDATYGFTTISAVITALQGDVHKSMLACISLDITPFIGTVTQDLLTYIPLLILVSVAIATVSAAIFSPWGTWDVFRSTSNYGREVRLLRMMTPGFGDCLNYLQFIVLTGCLNLRYPGFFQPAVSGVAWSTLMFNQSFVTGGTGNPAVVDGIYIINGTYGLDNMSQLIGMKDDQDLWAGMMVWLMTVIGAIVILIQIAFLGRMVYRFASRTQEEDLRAKNLPFSAGNTIRVVFNYFMVPITAFSFYQLVIASTTTTAQTAVVAMAVVTIVALLGFIGWMIWVIIDARPRSFLFDDLPTLLLYGPLYNTYSDSAAPFAVANLIINFIRGVAIGAVQPSGIAQIVLLAICEVTYMLTLNAFRPHFSGTYMNLINTLFSITRLVIIVLMVAFVPSLDINSAAKGYIGYLILIFHGLVLFTGFILRALSTLIELTARAAGAGEDSSAIGGFAKVLGLRQLARRDARDATHSRNSYASGAAMLNLGEKDAQTRRSRSASAASGLLLNGNANIQRQSIALESASGSGALPSIAGGPASTLSRTHTNGQSGTGSTFVNLRTMESQDPYFRAPRPRRTTMEMPDDAREAKSQHSMGSVDWAGPPNPRESGIDLGEAVTISGRGTPLGFGSIRDRTDSVDERKPKPDYATREVDYYYGVRGPALSHAPTRRLKTGPNDPTGPVSSATGFLKGLFGNKTKEKGKGFEVVRSARAPPQMEMEPTSAGRDSEQPYADDPDGEERPRLQLDDEGDAVGGGTRHLPGEAKSRGAYTPMGEEGFPLSDLQSGSRSRGAYSQAASDGFQLPELDIGESLPSRWNSTTTHKEGAADMSDAPPVPQIPDFDELLPPDVPRKSSKRISFPSAYSNSNADSTERIPRFHTPGGTPTSSVRGMTPPRISTPPRANTPPRINTPTKLDFASGSNWPLGNGSGTNLAGGRNSSQRLPFGDTLQVAKSRHNRTHSDRSDVSGVSGMSFKPPSHREDRPSSFGTVQQHRASDGLRVVPGSQQAHGSAAELVQDDRGPSEDERR